MLDPIWYDTNHLVRTKKDHSDSGNGYLYTVIAYALGIGVPTFTLPYLKYKSGILKRTPDNKYGQDSHDNYMACAVFYLMREDSFRAKEVLKAFIKNFGFMRNSFEKGDLWRSQMIRFPQVWFAMIAAAFPHTRVKFLMRNCLKLYYWVATKFQPIDYSNASACQLNWLGYYAIMELGDDRPMRSFIKKLHADGTSMSDIMRKNNYWDKDHPVLKQYDLFERLL